jgi:hypothetical protein
MDHMLMMHNLHMPRKWAKHSSHSSAASSIAKEAKHRTVRTRNSLAGAHSTTCVHLTRAVEVIKKPYGNMRKT